ncbi:MAG: hypothetical protein JSV54_06410 [Chloroflexota bacterium]|nr:MAG: hypothetical protein JSV54_06410 [Chloroflexota bacterium]
MGSLSLFFVMIANFVLIPIGWNTARTAHIFGDSGWEIAGYTMTGICSILGFTTLVALLSRWIMKPEDAEQTGRKG